MVNDWLSELPGHSLSYSNGGLRLTGERRRLGDR
jgi:hypothetical protein